MALRQCVAVALRQLSSSGAAPWQQHAAAALAQHASAAAGGAAVAVAPWRSSGGVAAPSALRRHASRPFTTTSQQQRQQRQQQQQQDDGDAERAKLASKLLYRARQRGFLELDLLVGLWAEAAVPRMSAEQLREFATVLDEENPDLFKWLTGQLPVPDRLAANTQFAALKAAVDAQLAGNLHAAAAAAAGRDWVRGWDDGNSRPGQQQEQGQAGAAEGRAAAAEGRAVGGAK